MTYIPRGTSYLDGPPVANRSYRPHATATQQLHAIGRKMLAEADFGRDRIAVEHSITV